MKIIPFIVVLAAGIAGLYFTKSADTGINPILGDESYLVTYGKEVPKDLSEKERIQIHLSYVENILKRADVSHLSPQLRANRKKAIDLLHTYWQNGEFPSNYDYPGERKPCFRDKNDQICAVGYLIQQTGNEDLVKAIESSENYATIYEMTNPKLIEWVNQSGLTLTECAMIQPSYIAPIESDDHYIEPSYAISSSVISGVSLASSMISLGNLKQSIKGGWMFPAIGMASGASQLTLGAINYTKVFAENPWGGYQVVHQRHQNLSMFNIGFGTFTTLFNGYALVRQLQGKKTRNDLSWNVYGFQSPSNKVSFGFNLVKRF